MRTQRGFIYRKNDSWFVRFRDDVVQDGAIKRVLVTKKIGNYDGDKYRTEASVRHLADDILRPINDGKVNPHSTMLVTDFVKTSYLPEYVEKELRPASRKQYRDIWKRHVEPAVTKLGKSLRDFETADAQKVLKEIAKPLCSECGRSELRHTPKEHTFKAGTRLGPSSLRHAKAFLGGVFAFAKQSGVLRGVVNPVHGTKLPTVPESEIDTYAYSLGEIRSMLARLKEPERTLVLCAAFSGLRKSELLGLTWGSFNGKQLNVTRSVWNGFHTGPKTKSSKAAIPVIQELAAALSRHKARAGRFAEPQSPIFQAGNGKPLNLDNTARRIIRPAIERCVKCRKPEAEHEPDGHLFELGKSLAWHGWHAFRRGLATNLHALGVPDKEIQAMLRHSTLKQTTDIYIKAVPQSVTDSMTKLGDHFAVTAPGKKSLSPKTVALFTQCSPNQAERIN